MCWLQAGMFRLLVFVRPGTSVLGWWHTLGLGRPKTSAPLVHRQIVGCSTHTQHIWQQKLWKHFYQHLFLVVIARSLLKLSMLYYCRNEEDRQEVASDHRSHRSVSSRGSSPSEELSSAWVIIYYLYSWHAPETGAINRLHFLALVFGAGFSYHIHLEWKFLAHKQTWL